MVATHLSWFSPRKLGEKISILTFLFCKGVGWWKATNQTLGIFWVLEVEPPPLRHDLLGRSTPWDPTPRYWRGSDRKWNVFVTWLKGVAQRVVTGATWYLWCAHPWNVAWNLKNHDLEKGQTLHFCGFQYFGSILSDGKLFNQRVDFKRRYASAQRTEQWSSVRIGKAWYMGVSLNGGTLKTPPKWSFLVGKPHGCWVPPF